MEDAENCGPFARIAEGLFPEGPSQMGVDQSLLGSTLLSVQPNCFFHSWYFTRVHLQELLVYMQWHVASLPFGLIE